MRRLQESVKLWGWELRWHIQLNQTLRQGLNETRHRKPRIAPLQWPFGSIVSNLNQDG
jgi:hypothetical protein